jgi:hypothetical protein
LESGFPLDGSAIPDPSEIPSPELGAGPSCPPAAANPQNMVTAITAINARTVVRFLISITTVLSAFVAYIFFYKRRLLTIVILAGGIDLIREGN